MIDYDAAVLRRAITADAADRVTRRHYLAWHIAQAGGARFLENLDTQVQAAAGYTPAEARRIVDEALEAENRRRARRRPTSTSTPAPSRPRILTVVP